MRFATLVETSAAVAAAPGRLDKLTRLSDLVGKLDDEELVAAVAFLPAGRPRAGWASAMRP